MRVLKELIKNKTAFLSLLVLGLLYLGALFAPFFSPYHFDDQAADKLWSTPTKVHFFDKEKKIYFRPFIYGQELTVDKYFRRVYREDRSQIHFIKFFSKGWKYKLFGLWESDRHFFGADKARIYLLGADLKGRDLLSRIIYGSRISLTIGIIGSLITFVLGVMVGGISGYYGGRTDTVLMRIVEMIMMLPGFYLMLALRASFPPHLSSTQIYLLLVVILSFIGWASFARVIRGMAMSLREREYVNAARAMGIPDLKIIIRHIIPHTMSYGIVALVLGIPGYILGESSLSLIGLGIQEPDASWGNLLSQAMGIVNIKLYPWILYPGLFIVIATMCFYVLGEALRDVLDPKRKMKL